MTTPNHPDHDQPPTVAEIAALTARLRDLSSRGRDADPAERAAFLADKQALLDRIFDTPTSDDDGRVRHTHAAIYNRVPHDADQHADDARDPAPEQWWAQAHSPDGTSVAFDASGYYSDAQLAAIGAAREAGEHEHEHEQEQAQALQNVPWTAQGTTVDTAHVAADDQHTERYITVSRGDAPAVGTDGDAVRREQLIRWHHDDHSDGHDDRVTDAGIATEHIPADQADEGDGAGWAR